MCFKIFCELNGIVSGEHIHMWSSDVEYTFMHYPTLWLIRKSNRIESSIFTPRFLLKNRSKSIVHLKAGIVTALDIGTASIRCCDMLCVVVCRFVRHS